MSWTKRLINAPSKWLSAASDSTGTNLVAGMDTGYIYTSIDSGVTWTARQTDTDRQWRSVASSSDGTKLVASAYGNYIYTSTDLGGNDLCNIFAKAP